MIPHVRCRRSLRAALLGAILLAAGVPVYAQGDRAFDSLLAEGKRQFRRGEALRGEYGADTAVTGDAFRRAIAALEGATELAPGNQEAHYFLGYAYDRLSTPIPSFKGLRGTLLEPTLRISREMEKVIAISRRYDGETLTLDPFTKISAAWGSLALAYACAGRLDSARWAFERGRAAGGFPDGTLVACRNVLRSCGHDAILLTNGDNDTFPVWYLQLVEGYRADVTVVNLSLANDPEYAKFMRARYPFGANPMPLAMSDRQVDKLGSRYVRKPERVVIPVPPERLKELGASERREVRGQAVTLTLHGRTDEEWRHVITVQDAILIDILQANRWSRPVYFHWLVEGPALGAVGLGAYLRAEGVARRIMPYVMDASTNVDVVFTDSLLLSETNGFEWMPEDAYIDDDGSRHSQELVFSVLLDETLRHATLLRDTATTERMLDRMKKRMPATRFRYLYNEEVLEVLEIIYMALDRPEDFKEIIEVLSAKQSLLEPAGPSDGAGGFPLSDPGDPRS